MAKIGKHPIQKHILKTLSRVKSARFTDLRPAKTETNLLTYHLQVLLDKAAIEKKDDRYFLTQIGVEILESFNQNSSGRQSAGSLKVLMLFVIQNSNGDLLLQRRKIQPHLDTWSLPFGDPTSRSSVKSSAHHHSKNVLRIANKAPVHAGDGYIRLKKAKKPIETTLVHIFKVNDDDIKTSGDLIWVRPHKLDQYDLAPAVDMIVARTFFNDPFFFEEFSV